MKKLGIVGCGVISEFLLGGARKAGLDVAAVCDVDRARAEYAAAPFRAKAYTEYAELLADSNVDGVIVALPNHMHFEPVMQALDAGKNVFCEKPMTIHVAESAQIVEKVKETGLVFQMGYMKRFNAGYMALKEAMPKLAPVTAGSIRLNITYGIDLDKPRPGGPASWSSDIEKSGGGPLVHGGSHLLDLMMFLFGVPENVTGQVVLDKNRNEYLNHLFFRMQDGTYCHWEFCGTRARGFGEVNGMWEEHVDVVGVNGKGMVENSDWQGRINPITRITLAGEEGAKQVFTYDTSAWANELVAFVKGMEEGKCLGSTAVDGYRVDFMLRELMKLTEARDSALPLEFAH